MSQYIKKSFPFILLLTLLIWSVIQLVQVQGLLSEVSETSQILSDLQSQQEEYLDPVCIT